MDSSKFETMQLNSWNWGHLIQNHDNLRTHDSKYTDLSHEFEVTWCRSIICVSLHILHNVFEYRVVHALCHWIVSFAMHYFNKFIMICIMMIMCASLREHRNFGQITTKGIFIFFLWNLYTICGQGVALRDNNLNTFWLHG